MIVFPVGKMKYPFFHPESWELEVIKRLVICVGPGLIELPQPGTEVPRNPNDPIARGSPELPQPGTEVANSPDDLCAICLTKTRPEPSLGPQANTNSLSLDPIVLEEMPCTGSSFTVITLPCATGIALHQKTVF